MSRPTHFFTDDCSSDNDDSHSQETGMNAIFSNINRYFITDETHKKILNTDRPTSVYFNPIAVNTVEELDNTIERNKEIKEILERELDGLDESIEGMRNKIKEILGTIVDIKCDRVKQERKELLESMIRVEYDRRVKNILKFREELEKRMIDMKKYEIYRTSLCVVHVKNRTVYTILIERFRDVFEVVYPYLDFKTAINLSYSAKIFYHLFYRSLISYNYNIDRTYHNGNIDNFIKKLTDPHPISMIKTQEKIGVIEFHNGGRRSGVFCRIGDNIMEKMFHRQYKNVRVLNIMEWVFDISSIHGGIKESIINCINLEKILLPFFMKELIDLMNLKEISMRFYQSFILEEVEENPSFVTDKFKEDVEYFFTKRTGVIYDKFDIDFNLLRFQMKKYSYFVSVLFMNKNDMKFKNLKMSFSPVYHSSIGMNDPNILDYMSKRIFVFTEKMEVSFCYDDICKPDFTDNIIECFSILMDSDSQLQSLKFSRFGRYNFSLTNIRSLLTSFKNPLRILKLPFSVLNMNMHKHIFRIPYIETKVMELEIYNYSPKRNFTGRTDIPQGVELDFFTRKTSIKKISLVLNRSSNYIKYKNVRGLIRKHADKIETEFITSQHLKHDGTLKLVYYLNNIIISIKLDNNVTKTIQFKKFDAILPDEFFIRSTTDRNLKRQKVDDLKFSNMGKIDKKRLSRLFLKETLSPQEILEETIPPPKLPSVLMYEDDEDDDEDDYDDDDDDDDDEYPYRRYGSIYSYI